METLKAKQQQPLTTKKTATMNANKSHIALDTLDKVSPGQRKISPVAPSLTRRHSVFFAPFQSDEPLS
jgi:hypothetical protein